MTAITIGLLSPEEILKAMKREFGFKDKSGSQTGKPVAGRMTGLEIAQDYKENLFSKKDY